MQRLPLSIYASLACGACLAACPMAHANGLGGPEAVPTRSAPPINGIAAMTAEAWSSPGTGCAAADSLETRYGWRGHGSARAGTLFVAMARDHALKSRCNASAEDGAGGSLAGSPDQRLQLFTWAEHKAAGLALSLHF